MWRHWSVLSLRNKDGLFLCIGGLNSDDGSRMKSWSNDTGSGKRCPGAVGNSKHVWMVFVSDKRVCQPWVYLNQCF